MDTIYSEKELLHPKQKVWGEWSFSMTKEQRSEKLAALLKHKDVEITVSPEHENWKRLFSFGNETSKGNNVKQEVKMSVCEEKSDNLMEYEEISSTHEETKDDSTAFDDVAIEDISSFLAEVCNKAGKKLILSLDDARNEMMRIQSDLEKFNKNAIVQIMEKTWAGLSSNDAKICFCIPFTSSVKMCQIFYKTIFLEWFIGSPNKRIVFTKRLSEMFSVEGDKVCRYLIAPALRLKSEDNKTMDTVFHLTLELMSSMSEKHWSSLLNEYIAELREFDTWGLNVLKTIMEHASPSVEDLTTIVQLMSSNASEPTILQSREFGLLLVAVASCLKSESKSLVPALKLIAENIKGYLKFKALKILNEIK